MVTNWGRNVSISMYLLYKITAGGAVIFIGSNVAAGKVGLKIAAYLARTTTLKDAFIYLLGGVLGREVFKRATKWLADQVLAPAFRTFDKGVKMIPGSTSVWGQGRLKKSVGWSF